MAFRKILRHPLSPIARRSAYALFAIFVVMLIGTVGVKELEGYDWVYSFFFMSMVATGQGPPTPNITGNTALIFVSVMAFISTGTVITSIGVIFGPFFGYLIHKGVRFSERELEKLQLEKKNKGKEEELGGSER